MEHESEGSPAAIRADEVPTAPMTLPSGRIRPEENIEQGLASPDENARAGRHVGAFCGLRRIEMTSEST